VFKATSLYRDSVYIYNEYLVNFFYQRKGFNLFYLQIIFIGCYLIYVIYSFFNDPRIKCPNCKKLNDFELNGHEPELLDMDTNKELTHGRITNSGRFDRRFNTEMQVTHNYTYKAQCTFCQEEFIFSKQQSFTENV
jgi:phage FluMu protein Com